MRTNRAVRSGDRVSDAINDHHPSLRPFQRVEPSQGVKYALFGAVEHSGRLSGGHYTAYVRVRHDDAGRARCHWRQSLFNGIHGDHQDGQTMTSQMETTSDGTTSRTDLTPETAKENEKAPKSAFSPGKWYFISDTHVKESSEHEVLKCQAYLLFYERLV